MKTIIYTTNTGSAERYARLLSQETGLPACSLAEAKKKVPSGAEIIYLGWIMAGSVKGYADAAKRYQVRAVCAVGMGQTGTQTDEVRKKNRIPASIPLFTLQGNFDIKKAARHLPFHDGAYGQNRRKRAIEKGRPHTGGGRYAGHDASRRPAGARGEPAFCAGLVQSAGITSGE